jgi:hypothetical protein
VVAIDLATTNVKWRRALPETPVGIAMSDGGLVIASAKHLYEADPTGVRSWRTNAAAATAITASDDGSVVLIAEGSLLEAATIDGRQTRKIALGAHGKAIAVAAMPRPSSLVGVTAGAASPVPAADPPATDTLPVANLLPKFSVIGWIGGAVSFVLVFFGTYVWLTRRRAHRRPAQ